MNNNNNMDTDLAWAILITVYCLGVLLWVVATAYAATVSDGVGVCDAPGPMERIHCEAEREEL